ncbi:hypothetical protein Sste5346_006495 [Sporothrix stenoceras]|uniref:Ureidoglycolate hydrolase n=1 Tax=Sporothrix stenoceras TaxID=5173 RepID=A0ABR3YY78_9PEZI
MTLSILCQPLRAADYAPYGGVISTDVVTDRTVVVNNGTARRTPEVVPTINKYSEAPSQTPARTVLNVSLASPREVQPWEGEEEGKRVMKIKMLERHRFSTQSFVPMGADIQYLVVVTQNKSECDDSPDLDKLQGFVARDKQGVCYAPGVWHAPMAVIDNPVSFAIVQHVNGVADEDCQFYHLDEEIEIVF